MKCAFLALIIACFLWEPASASAASHEIRLLSDASRLPPSPPSLDEELQTHIGGWILLLSSVDGAEWQLVIRP